nr:MAG TPA: portal protein [Caudoviricetes sp.]
MHAWNAFSNWEQRSPNLSQQYGLTQSFRPDRNNLRITNERSIIASILTRMAMDVASIDLLHVRLDEDKRFLEEIDSGLNNCLTVEANLDQAARAFRQDIAQTLFDEGVAAIVPVDTTLNPNVTGGYDILTLRVGKITEWMPKHIKVDLYNEEKGKRQQIVIPKKMAAIVENPLYSVMNEPNSTLQRLIRALNTMDTMDEKNAQGKLDLIIQLPYTIKSEARQQQAEKRRKDIEFQLTGSKYGIAYTDATEKVTQLNRPVENNLLQKVEYLTKMLYSQLGLTEEIMSGTADERAMLNYNNRTIEPVVTAIVEAMRRTFLTKTARSQRQSIVATRNPFRLVPVDQIAEIADKFTRNEIMTANEIRSVIGMRPADDPKADELRNSNMPQEEDSGLVGENEYEEPAQLE